MVRSLNISPIKIHIDQKYSRILDIDISRYCNNFPGGVFEQKQLKIKATLTKPSSAEKYILKHVIKCDLNM